MVHKKEFVSRTIKFQIKDKEACSTILSFLKSAAHLRNMLIILMQSISPNRAFYLLFLNANILRAVLYERAGGKASMMVKKFLKLSKDMPADEQDMLQEIITLAKTFDAKHIYKVVKSLIGEIKGFYTKIKKGEKASLPRAKKLRMINQMALPVDAERVYIKEGHLLITLGKHGKIKVPFNNAAIDKLIGLKNIISYRVCYDGRDVTLNITYTKEPIVKMTASSEKVAAIDPGVNNLCSLIVLDDITPSTVLSGSEFKAYNHNFNQKKSLISSQKDRISNRLNILEDSIRMEMDENEDISNNEEILEELEEWRTLKPKYDQLKKKVDKLYADRKAYFDTNFHKVARSLLRYLEGTAVTKLLISRDILSAKNRTNMGKRGNQRFVYIPYSILVNALELYGVEHGVEVITDISEAYSSKTNALYGNVLEAQNALPSLNKRDPKVKDFRASVFHGRRHKGAFYCNITHKVWHSDLNGALNLLTIYFKSLDYLRKMRLLTFKLESPRVIKGRDLFEWLDRPLDKLDAA